MKQYQTAIKNLARLNFMKVKILTESDVITIHDTILTESGGLAGLSRDKSLASALHRILDYITYEGVSDIYELAAFMR